MRMKVNEPIFRNYCYCGNLKKMAGQAGYFNVGVGVIASIATVIAVGLVGFFNYQCIDEVGCVPRFLHYSELKGNRA
jgi:hypothetical protein